MRTKAVSQLAAVLLVSVLGARAALDSRMVLLNALDGGTTSSTGKLELVCLSTMDGLVL